MVGTAEYHVAPVSRTVRQNESGLNLSGATTVPPESSVDSVDATSPCTWNSGMTQSETQVQSSSANYLATRVAGRAIERVQVPDDLVGAVMFLSSAASDFMTGQTVNVDGGRAMH